MNVELSLNSYFARQIKIKEVAEGAEIEFAGRRSQFGFSPVALISYAKNTRLVLIAESLQDHHLYPLFIPAEADFDPGFLSGQGRLLQLPDVDELIPLQLGIQHVHTQSFRSIKSAPALNIGFMYYHPERDTEVLASIDELHILSAFAGIRGGIAVFDGNGRREDNALVVEGVQSTGVESATFAGVLFFHPEDPELFDSVAGLEQFIKSFNRALIETGLTPTQERVKNVLEWLYQAPAKTPDAALRREILLAKALSSARLYDRFGNHSVKSFIDLVLSQKPGWWRYHSASKADQFITSSITLLGSGNTESPLLPPSPDEPKYLKDLRFPQVKKLRLSLPADLETTEQAMEQYMKNILQNVKNTTNPELLEDYLKLIKELQTSRWGQSHIGTNMHIAQDGYHNHFSYASFGKSIANLESFVTARIVQYYNFREDHH